LAQETGEALIALVDRLDSLPSTSALVGLLTP
jgi:hypothetical protein